MKYFAPFILLLCAAQAAATTPYGSQFYQDFISAAWYERHGEPQKAFEYYETLNAALPGDVSILKGLAQTAIATENKAAMDKYIPAFYAAAPDNIDALAARAAWLWSKGDLSGARAAYEKAIKLAPDNADIIFKYVTLLSGMDSDKAIAYLKTLTKEYPHLEGLIALHIAELYLRAKDNKSAVKYLQQISKQHPELPEPHLGLVKIYESAGQTSAVLAQYLEMEKAGIADADILSKIGAYYVLENKKDLSHKYFLQAKFLDAGNPTANQFLSLAAQDAGDWRAAIKYLTASRDYDKTPSYHVRAAYFYNRIGDAKKAAEVLKNAYNKFNKNAEIGIYYSLALIDERDYKTAAKILREVLATTPNNEVVLFHLAYVYERQKNYKEMEKYLQQLIQLNPNHADALNFLGYYLVDKTKRIEEGGGYIKRAIAIKPQDIAFIDSLAWYYYKSGDAKQALNLLQGIVDNAGQDGEILLHMAIVYEHTGDFAAAQKYYKKLLELEPQNKEAQAGLKRVERKL